MDKEKNLLPKLEDQITMFLESEGIPLLKAEVIGVKIAKVAISQTEARVRGEIKEWAEERLIDEKCIPKIIECEEGWNRAFELLLKYLTPKQ